MLYLYLLFIFLKKVVWIVDYDMSLLWNVVPMKWVTMKRVTMKRVTMKAHYEKSHYEMSTMKRVTMKQYRTIR